MHKRSWDRDEELYRLRIKAAFGDKRLNQITRHQVQSFHSALATEGLAAATANHHIKVLRSSLNLARQWGMLEGENPAAGIAMLHEDNKVEHYLDDDQLQRSAGGAPHRRATRPCAGSRCSCSARAVG